MDNTPNAPHTDDPELVALQPQLLDTDLTSMSDDNFRHVLSMMRLDYMTIERDLSAAEVDAFAIDFDLVRTEVLRRYNIDIAN